MVVFLVITIVSSLFAAVYWLFMSSYSQIFGHYPYKADTTEKVVALTFDDGPNEPYTSQIVNYLDSKNIKATFFQVGKCVERYPETTQKMIASGHIVGNHSLSHEFHKYFLSLDFETEILQNQTILEKYTGYKPALFRSPWLMRQPRLLKTLRRNNLQPVSGKFCYALEVFQPSATKIAHAALSKIKPGSIIIFHDGVEGRGGDRHQTADAVKLTVEELIKRGFTFTTVDKLLSVPAYQ